MDISCILSELNQISTLKAYYEGQTYNGVAIATTGSVAFTPIRGFYIPFKSSNAESTDLDASLCSIIGLVLPSGSLIFKLTGFFIDC